MAARIPKTAEGVVAEADFREGAQQDFHLLRNSPHPTGTIKSKTIIRTRLPYRMLIAEDAD